MQRFKYGILIWILTGILEGTAGQKGEPFCPPQELILPCRCTPKGAEIQVWCSHSDLPRILMGIKSVAKYVKQPIDEMILENNQLLSLPNKFFSPLQIVRLMLRNNGVERLAPAWLTDLEDSLVEIFIVERNLRSLPIESLSDCRKLRAVTIQSAHLKRAPSFARLPLLRYIKIESNNLVELPPYGISNLNNLESVHIADSSKLSEIKAGMFENLERLKTLNLNNNGLVWTHLHAFINLPIVHTIDLSRNRIYEAGMIGRAVKDLTKLEYLRLDHNNISQLTEGSFVDLPSLKELYLNDNSISEIHYGAFHKTPRLKLIHLEKNFLKRVHPESFLQSSGSGVEFMHVQHNDITEIEEIRSLLDALPMLKFLDLSYNKLEVIPFGVLRGHASLEQLCFDHNWIRLIEQDAFMAMPALRELRLKNNSLTENGLLPYWNLPSLKGLDLSYNKFTILNRMILMGLPSLRRLDISHNQLRSIDEQTFEKNVFIETINIAMNDLSKIDANTFRTLNNLFEIDASYNQLQHFLQGLPSFVERVNLENNQISTLPNASNLALANLRMLNIGSNQLNEIQPNVFVNLHKLRSLLLDNNRLKTIDEYSLSGLINLETLDLQENNLIKLHERSLATLVNLRNLNVQGNHLEILTNNILKNPQLKTFDVSRNNLMEIQDQVFANTMRLLSLDLSENRLRDLPATMANLRDLKDVDLSFNRLSQLSPEIISSWRILEEFRASNNNITELPENAFVNLSKLQYLDLSSNDIKGINSESIKNLPNLGELVLAHNQLTELNNKPFENLPNLQALHLQKNRLRYISPESFRGTGSLVYLNLSQNNFENLEHMGLHNARNLEVLDISYNKVQRILTNPLRYLDWLVELKVDNNLICKVQGTPFTSMPRLKVLSLRNNRMASLNEQTFSNLRGNLAVFDVDGNPLDCSCEMLWLHAWYKQTNSYPGPRCRDGSLLTEQRISKSDCEATMDNRLNQVLLTNDHGDVFKRQINSDECENIHLSETYPDNIPSSPTDSEYFEKPFVDYPINDNGDNLTLQSVPVFPHHFNETHNINRNKTLLNYNQHKLQQLHHNNPGSRFTFFGYPLPSLSNMWSGDATARKSASRSSIDSNGKSRLRNYRPRPDELIDEFQFSKGTSRFHEQNISGKNANNDLDFNEYNRPNEFPLNVPQHVTPNQVERGGFIPMLPGLKGFTPINNPNQPNWGNKTRVNVDRNEEHLSSDSLANESVHINEDKDDALENVENRYPVRVSTLGPEDVRPPPPLIHNSESDIPNTTNTINIISKTTSRFQTTTPPVENDEKNTALTQNANAIEPRPASPPILFSPNGTDVINLSKNAYKPELNDTNQIQNRNVLSALVAPGANQGSVRSSGRPTITKVFTTSSPVVPVLPFAEEYLRTTHSEVRNNSLSPYDTTPLAITKTYSNVEHIDKEDMDWYFNNYNKSKDKEPKSDLNRFRSSGAQKPFLQKQCQFVVLILVCLFIRY